MPNTNSTENIVGWNDIDNAIRYKPKEDIAVINKCKEAITQWLKSMDLELKSSKTRIYHTLIPVESNNPGFKFWGFNIQQYHS